jgi:2-polyprenyl-6-methoxyphenol hydroxylase-like FAD-dependent oxidoreductase
VFFIGSHTGSQVTARWLVPKPGTPAIHLDIDVRELGRNYPIKAGLLGDAKTVLQQMLDAAGSGGGAKRAPWLARVKALVEEWRDAALAAGVEIVTSSPVAVAEPAGALLLEDGRRMQADLVVGCDGFGSKVRESLRVGATSRKLPTMISRYLVPHRRFTRELITTENYAGQRRIGVTPCGEEHSYIFTVAPLAEEAANRLPLDVDNWAAMFPNLRELLQDLAGMEGSSFQYGLVRCPQWQKGRVALVGDAATGMPPTLGQGAGLTIMNARALAEALARAPSVEEALPKWERAVRQVSDLTQNWALRYDWITRTCPPQLAWLKPVFLATMRAVPAINRRMRIADRGMDVILPRVQAATA